MDVSRDCPILGGGYPLLSQERVELQTSNLTSTFTGPIHNLRLCSTQFTAADFESLFDCLGSN